jgi:hypothetical protein
MGLFIFLAKQGGRAMAEEREASKVTRLLAIACSICPLCILVRRFPKNAFARAFDKIRAICLFCHAYKKVKRIEVQRQELEDVPVAIKHS